MNRDEIRRTNRGEEPSSARQYAPNPYYGLNRASWRDPFQRLDGNGLIWQEASSIESDPLEPLQPDILPSDSECELEEPNDSDYASTEPEWPVEPIPSFDVEPPQPPWPPQPPGPPKPLSPLKSPTLPCDPEIQRNCVRILASISLLEAGLSRILNAEGEKIQKAIKIATSVNELVAVNASVRDLLAQAVHLENALCTKLVSVCNCCGRKCPSALLSPTKDESSSSDVIDEVAHELEEIVDAKDLRRIAERAFNNL